MVKNNLILVLFTLSLVIILSFSYLSDKSPITNCQQSRYPSLSSERYITYPEKVVVKPWRGQHHVYGIFMIPGGYLNNKLFTVKIPGTKVYCGVLAYGGTKLLDGVDAKRGYYLMKGMLNTRSALWLLWQGKGDQLKQVSNWTLGYSRIEQK